MALFNGIFETAVLSLGYAPLDVMHSSIHLLPGDWRMHFVIIVFETDIGLHQ